jgi:serine protease Do
MSNKFGKIIAVIAAAFVVGATAGIAFFGASKLTGALDAYKSQRIENSADEETPDSGPGVQESQQAAESTAQTPKTTDNTNYVSIGNDVSSIVEACMPSVVSINVVSEVEGYSWFGGRQTYEQEGSGSGIIVGENDDEYLIVTNDHVIEDATQLKVTFIDGESIDAAVKGSDSATDIAVIAAKKSNIKDSTKSSLKVATIGDSTTLKPGQGVIAIGNALGYGQSVTVGYISAVDREVSLDENTTKKLIQTDAAINPGNSGGALINMKGEIIGINEAKLSSTDVEGIGYAIPISQVLDVIENFSTLETREQVDEADRGYLGIQGVNVDSAMAKQYDMPTGAYVYRILENSGAANSDLREKDIITKVDGMTIADMSELQNKLSYYKAGETVTLTVSRLEGSEYVEKEITLTLSNRSAIEEEETRSSKN